MNTFFHQETAANQFALTYAFQGTNAPDPSSLPVLYWLTFFGSAALTLQVFFQHPDADADHRLVLRSDVISGETTTEYHLDCGKGGIVIPRAAVAPSDNVTQISNGVPWSLRVITTGKTADAFLDIGWAWERVA